MWRVAIVLVMVLSLGLVMAVPAAATDPGTTVTLTVPDNVYRPAEFVVSSTATNSGTAYTNVRFNITVSGPEAFTGDRADTFTITGVNGSSETQGINDTFVLVDGDWVGYWGPVGGFPLLDPYSVPSTFTVEMCDVATAPLGNYDVTVELVDLTPEPDVILATATDSFSLSADTLYVGTTEYEYQFNTIQDAIGAAEAGDTINVAAGTYDEQVAIGKSLTLVGSGDATIIQPSGPVLTATTSIPWIGGGTGTMSAIVSVLTAGDEVTIRDLEIDGSLITSKTTTWVGGLVYLETSGKIEGVTVNGGSTLPDRTAGIFAAAINEPTSLEVTGCTVEVYTRAGIYALGGKMTANYHDNEINGPGSISEGVPNGIFFLEGANGSATYNVVTDLAYNPEVPDIYQSTGIGTYGAGTNVRFAYNTVYGVQNAFVLAKDTSGTIVEYNEVYDCHTGVKFEGGASNSIIRYNDIHDNDFAIRGGVGMGTGNVVNFNNFANNPGPEWFGDEDATYEGAVCNLSEVYDLDATLNWWGDISGPEHEVPFEAEVWPKNPGGIGDTVSDQVNYEPWLTRPFETVLADNIAYFGFPMVHLNTGWNIFSTPVALDPDCDTWGDYLTLGDSLAVDPLANAYYFDGQNQRFEQVLGDYPLNPCDAIYVKMTEPDIAAILCSPGTSVPSKDLYAGWNLVSLALLDEQTMPVSLALSTVGTVTGDMTGWDLVVSPPVNQAPWMEVRGTEDGYNMEITEGYWVFMINDGTLAGFTFTPMSLGER